MQINLSRIKNLLKRDLIVYQKPLLYGILTFVLLSFLFIAFPTFKDNFNRFDTEYWAGLYFTSLFGGGSILTCILFWEFKSAAGRIQYLSLPASNADKLIARSFYVIFLYPVLLTLWFYIIYKIARVMGHSNPLENELVIALKYIWGGYVIMVTIYLIYAIIFNNNVVPKTMLVNGIINFAIIALGVLLTRLVMFDLFEGGAFNIDRSVTFLPPESLGEWFKSMRYVWLFLLFIVTPAYFWTIAYFKMKEKEA